METAFPEIQMDQPARYTVWVRGQIDSAWRDWFEGFEPRQAGEFTCLTGSVPDQAALLGLLQRLSSLGFPLLRVELA